jgi:hypothetical protein
VINPCGEPAGARTEILRIVQQSRSSPSPGATLYVTTENCCDSDHTRAATKARLAGGCIFHLVCSHNQFNATRACQDLAERRAGAGVSHRPFARFNSRFGASATLRSISMKSPVPAGLWLARSDNQVTDGILKGGRGACKSSVGTPF